MLYPLLAAERTRELPAALGALALGLLVVGMLRVPLAILPALILGGVEYVAWLEIDRQGLDAAAPFVAAALVLAGELAYRSVEARGPVPPAPGENGRRALDALGAAGAGAGVGLLVLALGEASTGGGIRSGLALEVLGLAAAVGAFALVSTLSRSIHAVDSSGGAGAPRGERPPADHR